MNKFDSEAEMSIHFHDYIKDSTSVILKEHQGLFGIPDYILFNFTDKDDYYIISVELKLKNWKRAIAQAFRYLSFSNKSFVIMDEKFINPAVSNINLFKQYNIGLASFNKNQELKVYFNPDTIVPFNSDTTKKLVNSVSLNKKRKSKMPVYNTFIPL